MPHPQPQFTTIWALDRESHTGQFAMGVPGQTARPHLKAKTKKILNKKTSEDCCDRQRGSIPSP